MATVAEYGARLYCLPTLDFAAFLDGRRDQAAAEIPRACETIGIFYLSNHGVDRRLRHDVFAAAPTFFAAPVAVKMEEAIRTRTGSPRGCHRSATRTPRISMPIRMEMLRIEQLELPADDPDIVAGNRLHSRNTWPPGMPEVGRATISHHLLEAFALALELLPIPASAPTAPSSWANT